MENIFRLLKGLVSQGGMLGAIPKPIKLIMLYMGVTVGVMIAFRYAKLGQGEKTFLIVAAILVAIGAAVYYGWKDWTQKKQNQQFGGDISQHSSATPRSLSDPGQH